MKKIKVLFFIYQMGAGGAARTLLNIINNLDRSKFEPMLVTLNFNGSYESELEPDVNFFKLDTQRLSRSVFKIAKIIRDQKINIVFSTIPRVNTIAILANQISFSGAKNVIREADNLGGTRKENLKLLGFGMVYKLSKQIISLSEGVKENLVKRYKINADDIKVIYNPVDLKSIQNKITTGDMSKDHLSMFNTDDKTIITAGRLVPQKDQHTLIRAFAKVNKKIPSQLILLGEGPLKEELERLSMELHVRERVYFIGFQTNPYIYFKNSDLFVLTSKHEGFSHVIAEALATGTPVVSTDCKSGPAEVLNKGEFGELCEVGNVQELAKKMEEVLLQDSSKLEQVIEKGYQRASDFDATKIVNEYEQVFLKVTNN